MKMDFVLRHQTNRFRASVASAIIESSTTEAIVCVPRGQDGTTRAKGAHWIHEMVNAALKAAYWSNSWHRENEAGVFALV